MTRELAIQHVTAHLDSGAFLTDLDRRVALRTDSQEPDSEPRLRAYLESEMASALAPLGFTSQVFDNPVANAGPLLIATRQEDEALPTVLIYGHGDVVRGYDDQWRGGLTPWTSQRRRRTLVWPRHRRQQRPAQHQSGCTSEQCSTRAAASSASM